MGGGCAENAGGGGGGCAACEGGGSAACGSAASGNEVGEFCELSRTRQLKPY